MASIGTGYDLSSTTFSPDGRVFQIEYAGKAVENSGTVLGLRCVDGVVTAVEKTIVSKMLVGGTLRRSHLVDRHASVTICGLISDGRVIVDQARDECERYRDFYGRRIPGRMLADRLAHFIHLYTLHWHVRPFGCAAILTVCDDDDANAEDGDGPQLYLVEPSGVCYRYYACAFGKAKQAARTELEKLEFAKGSGSGGLTCDQAIDALARILVRVHDETKDKEYELEMVVNRTGHGEGEAGAKLVPRDQVNKAHKKAEEELEAEEMGDD